MILSKLKRDFLAAFPVIGPHTDIDGELMLAGLKPMTWKNVYPDNTVFEDKTAKLWHLERIRLDQAVAEGKLIAMDVDVMYRDTPEIVAFTCRHYAQPNQKENLEKVVARHKKVFNFEDPGDADLDKDMGLYLGYRRRDIALWSFIMTAPLPQRVDNVIRWFSGISERALGDKLLEQAGIKDRKQYWADVRSQINNMHSPELTPDHPS